MLITEIEDKLTKIIDKDDHDTFIYDFLSMYNIPKATITKLRKGINNLAKDDNEVYLKNKLYYKAVIDNKNLMQSYTDVKDKVDQIGSKPRYIVVTNFKQLLAYDTKTKDTLDIPFQQLPQKFEFFLAWNGIEKADFDKENPADIRAAERFAKLYDVIVKDNPSATREGLDLFLIRLLFCLFAEDTTIFPKNLFTNRIKELTKEDGSDLDNFVDQLFSVLDYPKSERPKNIPSWLNDFPYVDGDLFKANHESLVFTKKSRKLIIDAGELLEWNQINPDILGSMIQAVASEDSRSHLGMHYTSVPNIMKVIKPLFLDDLRKSFEDAKGNEQKLQKLYDRIGHIKFMDPACGSGNFLIITYKELRQLEIDIIKELNNMGIATMYVPSVTLDQFYGIEIDDFACDVTRLSLWIAEHQMNVKLHEEIADAVRPTLPLQHAGAIICGNALRLDWNEILPHKADDEVYLFGNPPYIGSRNQTKDNKLDLKMVFKDNVKYKKLDYVCSWYKKAAEFIKKTISMAAFVTTDSIFQGEQVAILWPVIFKLGIDISFVYTSFKWSNNAKNSAGVEVAIAGIKDINKKFNKSIYENSGYVKKSVSNISPYLSSGGSYVVQPQVSRNDNLPKLQKGNAAYDNNNFTFSVDEYKTFVNNNPSSQKLFKKYISASDFLNGKYKYCLWIEESQIILAKSIPDVKLRIDNVEKYRLDSKRLVTRKAAATPFKFGEIRWKNKPAMIIPVVSSENRYYLPIGYINSDIIPSYATFVIYDSPIWLLGILESKIHMIWIRTVAGKLGTSYRYSAELVYNTFPIPELSVRRKNEIEDKVYEILDIREEEGGTLADLYGSPLAAKNPKPMNVRLLKAHQELDYIVDRAYSDRDFKDDNERLSLLLKMYQEK
ncbi:class I SAM-dependent DNA methyltransferase [Lactobacillus sp. ESL0679]|uniref:class I SAM-dependent DNA methyltransferase n=1 Tax=Lactobacillus sp. ESL0679 TaxID=2983209 RepID=UPI0023FA4B0D|nr:DNA methyltransferase [Lactobacillus sp. ESL0679]MDF7683341.1 class I SAM-dependent DNA methyltransferase [Lactobacillus sp. ESL0679]